MKLRALPAYVLILAGCVSIGLSLGSMVRAALKGPVGPRIHLESPFRTRLIAVDEATELIASYRLVNEGDRDLTLGQVTTTCGCTIASIDPKVVKPRAFATIVVKGEPPEPGERSVQISVQTNDHSCPHLDLELTMVGATPMPFIGYTSGPIQFGTIQRDEAEADFYFDTHERQDVAAWTLDIKNTLPGLSIEPSNIEILATAGDTIIRRRNYHANYTASLPAEGFLGEVEVVELSAASSPVHKIQVFGIVHPPVYAIPSALYGSYDGISSMPSIRFSVISTPGFALELTAQANEAFTCQLTGRSGARSDFALTFEPLSLVSTLTSKVSFSTNHPKLRTLTIPLVIQRTRER